MKYTLVSLLFIIKLFMFLKLLRKGVKQMRDFLGISKFSETVLSCYTGFTVSFCLRYFQIVFFFFQAVKKIFKQSVTNSGNALTSWMINRVKQLNPQVDADVFAAFIEGVDNPNEVWQNISFMRSSIFYRLLTFNPLIPCRNSFIFFYRNACKSVRNSYFWKYINFLMYWFEI